jgi:hypothetical protein
MLDKESQVCKGDPCFIVAFFIVTHITWPTFNNYLFEIRLFIPGKFSPITRKF